MLHGRPGLQLLFRAVAAKGQLLLWAAPVQQPGARSQEPEEIHQPQAQFN
jgi:hypothetical protein